MASEPFGRDDGIQRSLHLLVAVLHGPFYGLSGENVHHAKFTEIAKSFHMLRQQFLFVYTNLDLVRIWESIRRLAEPTATTLPIWPIHPIGA